MPLRKVHELTFLWFGLPGPLLIGGPDRSLWRMSAGTSGRKPPRWSDFYLTKVLEEELLPMARQECGYPALLN